MLEEKNPSDKFNARLRCQPDKDLRAFPTGSIQNGRLAASEQNKDRC